MSSFYKEFDALVLSRCNQRRDHLASIVPNDVPYKGRYLS